MNDAVDEALQMYRIYELSTEQFVNRLEFNGYKIVRMEEKKMTRKEAIQKFKSGSYYNDGAAGLLVDGLEKLGLIKFDEETTAIEVIRPYVQFDSDAVSIENDLKAKGFLKCP